MNALTLGIIYLFVLSNRKDKAITTLLCWYLAQVTLTIIIYSPESFIFALGASWFYAINAFVCYSMQRVIKGAMQKLNDYNSLQSLNIILTLSIYLNLFGILDLVLNSGTIEETYNIFIKGAALLTVLEIWYLFRLSKNGLSDSLTSFVSNFARGLHGGYSLIIRDMRNYRNMGMGKKYLGKF
jgi:hypothetical protein